MSTADAPAGFPNGQGPDGQRPEGQRPDGQRDAVIHTEDLTKVYPGTDFAAVDKLNLDIKAGEIFGLLGPNGAGKTTTAGMLTTRVVPTSGRAFLGGIDVAAHPALAKQLSGIVSQQNTLDRQLTVWENLYFHGRLFGMGAKKSRQVADGLLEQFQLSKWAKASVYALSGGMAQRLMVARAIFHRPVIGISVMFQGVQSIALAMAQEFGFTREIEDRVQAPCPIWLVAIAKVLSGAAQGVLSAIIVLPIASVVHAPGVEAHLS